jgi:hypothetical protein
MCNTQLLAVSVVMALAGCLAVQDLLLDSLLSLHGK